VVSEGGTRICNDGPILEVLFPVFQEKVAKSRSIFVPNSPSSSFPRIQGTDGLFHVVPMVVARL